VLDIAAPLAECLDLGLIDVEAEHRVADFHETKRQRQSDIAHAENTDDGALVGQLREQSLFGCHAGPKRPHCATGAQGLKPRLANGATAHQQRNNKNAIPGEHRGWRELQPGN